MITDEGNAPIRSADTERSLARVARRQHGLLTNEQLGAAGLSLDTRKRRVQAGRWIAVAPGVVAVAGTAATWRQRTLAAVLAAGPGAVASHTTAAALFGLSGCPFRSVEITVPRGRSHRSRLATVHEARWLERCDVTTVDRVPVTRPARTLIDLAGCVPRAVLEDAVDDALVRRLTTLARLRERLDGLGGSGRPGTLLLRAVLSTWDTGELPEEVAEARLLRRLLAADLPAPAVQHDVCDPSGRVVARADLAYPAARVAVELDGFRWHGTPRGHARDQARARRLAALGWLVVPATPLDLAGPGDELARQVAPPSPTLRRQERAHSAPFCRRNVPGRPTPEGAGPARPTGSPPTAAHAAAETARRNGPTATRRKQPPQPPQPTGRQGR